MSRDSASIILFAQAKARIEEILHLIEEYNDLQEALVDLGYVNSDYDRHNPWPVPYLELCGNGSTTVTDSSVLDAFLERGPERRPKTQPISRYSMVKERYRLGMECGWKCFYCGKDGNQDNGPDGRIWHVDHAYPVIRGGDDQPDNHVLACATCNLDKKASTAMEYFKRLATVRKTA